VQDGIIASHESRAQSADSSRACSKPTELLNNYPFLFFCFANAWQKLSYIHYWSKQQFFSRLFSRWNTLHRQRNLINAATERLIYVGLNEIMPMTRSDSVWFSPLFRNDKGRALFGSFENCQDLSAVQLASLFHLKYRYTKVIHRLRSVTPMWSQESNTAFGKWQAHRKCPSAKSGDLTLWVVALPRRKYRWTLNIHR